MKAQSLGNCKEELQGENSGDSSPAARFSLLTSSRTTIVYM